MVFRDYMNNTSEWYRKENGNNKALSSKILGLAMDPHQIS